MRILFLGDVFGRPGRRALESHLHNLKSERNVDFCIANGENCAGGKGITQETAQELYSSGVDAITLGNHAWDNKGVLSFIDSDERIVRAYNYPPGLPGKGYTVLETKSYGKIVVAQLNCRLFMANIDCPFRRADDLLNELKEQYPIVIIDLHGEATSEKMALGWYLDGRVTAVLGTHTHVLTADERVLPQGTAYISDVGMTGAHDSVIGLDIECATSRFLTSLQPSHKIAKKNVKISAVLLEVDEQSGKTSSIERLQIDAEQPADE